ncbi:plant intracellular Ras-group-related LRR protein 4 isoform X1 [Drosophila ficusphila]|uniref:plant intracellular Ras-group-related LRR protein 4 isoform X1 n=2 Tax=Drosophila ficusphila TaxID=30025 RepID=UPI0007E60C71|nr:plant intracellular Ras-group-related LRR protein 4 isoform X1 [Drosophila ficusphila]
MHSKQTKKWAREATFRKNRSRILINKLIPKTRKIINKSDMERVCQFFRNNYVLANCEDAIFKKAFSLNLSHYQMSEVPDIIEQCETLMKLFLNQNKLTKIPSSIGSLLRLQVLTLDYNKLDEFPLCICRLVRLKFLNISCNSISYLPPEIGYLTLLETFWCNNTGLKELPAEIRNFERLETLGVRGNPLKKLTEAIGALTSLRWFTAEGCELTEVPLTMALLENLVHLNLKGNRLKRLPRMLMAMQKLRFVFLNENRIDELPTRSQLEELSTLHMLNLSKNPISLHQELQLMALRQNNLYVELPANPVEACDGLASRASMNTQEQQEDQARGPGQDVDSSDWANSVRTSELDTTDESTMETNIEDLSVMLPEMSRFVTTF